jgi:hypothetical protein
MRNKPELLFDRKNESHLNTKERNITKVSSGKSLMRIGGWCFDGFHLFILFTCALQRFSG